MSKKELNAIAYSLYQTAFTIQTNKAKTSSAISAQPAKLRAMLARKPETRFAAANNKPYPAASTAENFARKLKNPCIQLKILSGLLR